VGLLDDVMALDGEMMVDTDSGGESVSYVAKDGTARSINAIVFRNPPAEVPGTKVGSSPLIRVFVRNHATHGITSVNTGGDKLLIADRYGGPAADHYVSKILHQDAGGWMLELR